MKIDTLLAARPPEPLKPHQAKEDFAHFLTQRAKEPSGGDYYLHHQTRWQDSALNFKAKINQAKSQDLGLNQESKTKLTQSPSIEKLPRHLRLRDVSLNTPTLKLKARYMTLDDLHFNTSLRAPQRFNQLNAMRFQQKILNPPERIKLDTFCQAKPSLVLKPQEPGFHGFFDQGGLELSLGNAKIQPQQILDLKARLKEYLSKKNYYLKQLIVNGVKQ